MRAGVLACLVLALAPASSQAHKPSDSYLVLQVEGTSVRGRWDVALRDLDFAIGLDGNDDGLVSWGELRASEPALDGYALGRLRIAADGESCPMRVAAHQVDRHTDGAYAVLLLGADCAHRPRSFELDYGLFAELDPQHRGLVRVEYGGETRAAVLGAGTPCVRIEFGALAPWSALLDYGREGVWHIGIGTDHVLFLLSLLLPAVLRREAGRWQPQARLRPALGCVLRTVTAFTAAHSLTLSLAALGIVELPSRFVESAIAASVALAALNNLRPIVDSRRWLAAFGFGLLHGLGFASVLAGLGLSGGSLAPALLGFNLGVEAGQLVLVAGFLPLAWVVRRSSFYRAFAFATGSVVIALAASVWLLERSLDLRLPLPF